MAGRPCLNCGALTRSEYYCADCRRSFRPFANEAEPFGLAPEHYAELQRLNRPKPRVVYRPKDPARARRLQARSEHRRKLLRLDRQSVAWGTPHWRWTWSWWRRFSGMRLIPMVVPGDILCMLERPTPAEQLFEIEEEYQ